AGRPRPRLRALLPRPDAVPDELAGVVRALLTRPGAGAAWQAFQRHEAGWTRPRTYLAWQLGAIGCPVLLLSGGYDRLVPPDDVRAAATRIPHARFMLVAGAGHWLPRDPPRQGADQPTALLTAPPAAPPEGERRPTREGERRRCPVVDIGGGHDPAEGGGLRRSRFLLADGREDRRVPGDDEGTFQVGGSRAVAGHVPTGRYLSLVVGAKAWRRRRAF